MASIRICTRGNKLGSGLHLQIARLNLPAASLLPVSRDSSASEQEHRNRALVRLREYSTAKGRMGGWLKRQLYGWLLVAGLSGGALVLVSQKHSALTFHYNSRTCELCAVQLQYECML